MNLFTYLNFGGNCEEAFRFYERHLGGRIEAMMSRGEQPGGGGAGPEHANTIMFARMRIGETVLMGADVPEGFQPMRSAYLYLSAASAEEANGAFSALAEGGHVIMPIDDAFFAERFGMVRDRFGVLWMVIKERDGG